MSAGVLYPREPIIQAFSFLSCCDKFFHIQTPLVPAPEARVQGTLDDLPFEFNIRMEPDRWDRIEEILHPAWPAMDVMAKDFAHEQKETLVGRSVGPYKIISALGAGGMGEVYRARDTRLRRDVAIKILAQSFTSDPDRLARFEHEARMLAALNHPNIGAIYGLEDVDGIRALVLELVDGETLATSIARGPLALKDAIPIARQIAEALEAAHEKGIVHRDLKPPNVALTRDGTAKVLDFGLAKTSASDAPAAPDSDATTMTVAGTRDGVILGTASYMSPEQARGQAIDKRTDIWAFGCVCYEMLTGQVAFRGETVSDTIAAVLSHETDWKALPGTTPPNIRRLLERCLVKNPKGRLRDIGDARIELDDASISESTSPLQPLGIAPVVVRRWRLLALIAIGVLAVALSVLALTTIPALLRPGALDTSSYRFNPFVAEPADETYPSWSPDGKSIVYIAEVDGLKQLFIRSLDSAISTQITKSSSNCASPFWSPDSVRIYYITFDAGGQLWSVGATGGEPQLILNDVAVAAVAPDG